VATSPKQLDTDISLRILNYAFDGIVLLTHSSWIIQFANPVFASWLGKSSGELRGIPLQGVLGPGWPCDELLQLLKQTDIEPTREVERAIPIKFGPDGINGLRAKAFQLTGYETQLFGLVLQPLTSCTTYRHATRLDPLTALPDRTFLMSRLATLIEGERLADCEFAVLFIDLDNFKQVNDRYGHLAGDRVLYVVAERLRECVRECDHVTRYGGDEFVVLLERASGMSEIEPVLARIRAAFTEPLNELDEPLVITMSIGVVISAPHLRSPDDVLREADRAMYAARRDVTAATASSATATR